MTKDLATAFPRGNVNSVISNTNSDYFIGGQEGNFSTLTFTSLSRTPAKNAKESDQTEISYFIEPTENDLELFSLMRRDDPTIGIDGGGSEYPISERIVEFTLSYLGEPSTSTENQELAFEWNSVESSLPNAVNVNIVLRSTRGEDIEFNSLILIPIVN